MKILAFPAFRNEHKNPYNSRLYNFIKEQGHKVEEFYRFQSLKDKYHIFHIHWPDTIIRAKSLFFLNSLRLVLFYFDLIILKIAGTKIVWTAHNLRSHEYSQNSHLNQVLERIHISIFIKYFINAIIVLNDQTESMIKTLYNIGENRRLTFVKIPHPNYRGIYKTMDQQFARKELNLNQQLFTYGYFGIIRKYKNVKNLVECFINLNDVNSQLIIAGSPEDLDEVRAIEEMIVNEKNIYFLEKRLTNHEVSCFFSACDLTVLPYKNIHNSGSAILSLSMNKPILVPDRPVFSEFSDIVGKDWVCTYQELSADALKVAQEKAKTLRILEPINYGISKLDNSILASETLSFYELIIRK
ncbi:glycosyltransferase [Marinoscillum pacificum]|uniref:glycosyltransferase n=1 Tax=Marinoscillum pacificum TaxID=392723 RepID=UPI0021577586|nr:glycosyltransferase [Marinoscillum pacificum]